MPLNENFNIIENKKNLLQDNIYFGNARDSLIEGRSDLSKDEIDEIMNMNPINATEYLRSMNARDSLIEGRNDLSKDEIDEIINMNPINAAEYLRSMNVRDSLIEGRNDLSKDEIDEIMNLHPREAIEELLGEYYIVQPWDSLWKIVKKRLWKSDISDSEIVKEINFLVHLNPHLNIDTLRVVNWVLENWKDWIPWDLIFPWDKIKLTWTSDDIKSYSNHQLN